jgi:biopolymer transport protein ExbB
MLFTAGVWVCLGQIAWAEGKPPAPEVNYAELLEAGGVIGYIIIGLSVALIALVIEHLLSIRRTSLMPGGLAEEVHRLIGLGQFKQAEQQCKLQPSFLGYLLSAGLAEVGQGYGAVEKALEDASVVQSARLFRKVEYLNVISTIAPMLGLLGTVWGMILAFMEFEAKANPQVSELAPGIYHALVTTLQGLCVAIPALAAYAFFRSRVDELVAQTSLMAEHVFSAYKRSPNVHRPEARRKRPVNSSPAVVGPEAAGERIPPTAES